MEKLAAKYELICSNAKQIFEFGKLVGNSCLSFKAMSAVEGFEFESYSRILENEETKDYSCQVMFVGEDQQVLLRLIDIFKNKVTEMVSKDNLEVLKEQTNNFVSNKTEFIN